MNKRKGLNTLAVFVAAFAFVVPASVQAQTTNEELIQRLKMLEQRVHTLEAELETLKAAQTARGVPDSTQASSAPAAAQQAPPTVPTEAGQLPVYGGASALAKALNPDIGIIGNFVGAAGRNRINPLPGLSLQESEVSLQAIVDPYARGDFFLAFGEQGVEVEEGYVTFTSVPFGFVPKIGKMRASFGRVNTFHNHTLPWVDRPLVQFNLMGGSLEEADVGIKDAGISVTRILPAPKWLVLQGTGEVFRGDSGSLFRATQRGDIAVVGHLKGYSDLTETTGLEIGISYARGHNDLGSSFITQLYGADATLRWKPVRGYIHHSFAGRAEFVWSRREEPVAQQRAFGFFTSAEYQPAKRWSTGVRYDWSERGRNALQHDSSGSVVLTYWPSEFNQIRAQLRRTHYAEGTAANEVLLQFLFTLGAHGAHPF